MAGPSPLANLSLRAQLRVDRLPLRLAQMMLGLTGFGLSLAMLLRSGLGGAPWDVLHTALAERAGLSVGTVSITVSFLLLLAWIPLREQPGIGTIANSIWVGVSLDLGMAILPPASTLPIAVLMMVAGVVINGVSGAVYIGAQLGPGPRDGVMTGLGRRLRRPVGPVRIALEASVLAAGWALGGPVGVGTLAYAIGLGPVIQLVLPRVIMPVRTAGPASPSAAPETGEPVGPTPPAGLA
ncbi:MULTISPECIES: YitT family protein [unclassified Brachybacterium]|uniref:membrane protein YczE n=1 Tax=unclassified Brachybacterium TaxID=2623841 RepID=UPI00361EA2BB